MRTIKVYKFDERSDETQKKIVNEYRYINVEHQPWWDFSYESIKEEASIIGIEIKTRPRIPTPSPDIYFDDNNVTINGYYQYRKNSVKEIKHNKELHEIAINLQKIQQNLFYRGTAKLTHRGVETDYKEIEIELKNFYRWVKQTLDAEYDHLTSDQAVRETLIANEYEFLPDGRMV